MASKPDETRDGVDLTNLDQPLFDGAEATKRDLVDYLDAVHERILVELRDRPLSVIRIRPGQPAFMQKNVPKYTPDWVKTVPVWAEASKPEVSYALCDDRRTLLWFANQRAVGAYETSRLDVCAQNCTVFTQSGVYFGTFFCMNASCPRWTRITESGRSSSSGRMRPLTASR